MRLLILLAISILIGACGSSTPFQRGHGANEENRKLEGGGENDPRIIFQSVILPRLETSCSSCHDNKAPDYDSALSRVVPGRPEESSLYLKATGSGHRKVWAPESQEALDLAEWIRLL